MSKSKKTVKELIRAAKLPEKAVPICLHADLVAEVEAAERELADAQRHPADSLAAGGKARQVAERIEALRQQMFDHTVDFRLRALARPAWRALMEGHAPRKDDKGQVDERDKYVGVNVSTFFDALVRASVVEPELDVEDWRLLLDERLTDRQFDQLADAAWSLNRRDVDIPFSLAASRMLQSSGPE